MQNHLLFRDLLDWQPEAQEIQIEVCHCPGRALMLSYTLPDYRRIIQRPDGRWWQQCGYACTQCKFSQAGARLVYAPPAKGES